MMEEIPVPLIQNAFVIHSQSLSGIQKSKLHSFVPIFMEETHLNGLLFRFFKKNNP